jgi:hypothetical protein
MLQKLKSVFREVKNGAPGRRFLDHYERSRRREGGRGRVSRSWGYVGVGVVLLICGLVLSLPPAVPGFLLWIPGISLIASRSRRISILLDRLEVWARKAWRALRTSRRQ